MLELAEAKDGVERSDVDVIETSDEVRVADVDVVVDSDVVDEIVLLLFEEVSAARIQNRRL